jgi:hypothetical protein
MSKGPALVFFQDGLDGLEEVLVEEIFVLARGGGPACFEATVTVENLLVKSSTRAFPFKFSNNADTGILVPSNTHDPPSGPGKRSTTEHEDQSCLANRSVKAFGRDFLD